MSSKEIFEKIEELYPKYVKVWEDVCNIESPTRYKAGVDAVGNYFIELAKEKGWHIEISEQTVSGNALCITMNPESEENPVCISGHMDTVFPLGTFGTPAVRIDGNNIYGPGVVDCKGGIVASFLAMDALDSLGFKKRPVKLILQSDEETGSEGSNKETVKFMIEKAKDAVAFLNCEGCNTKKRWTVAIERKGILRYKITVKGKAVHSSMCYDGASAVLEAANQIIKLEKYKDKAGITCNCGVISGGTAANTVAEECTYYADIRFSTEEEMKEAMAFVGETVSENTVEGCNTVYELISDRPPMEYRKRNLELVEKINEICNKHGLDPVKTEKRNGGSDAAYITQAGIPCIDNIGVAGENIHSVNEVAVLSSLAGSAKYIAAITCFI